MQGWTHRDQLFVARTLVPERSDREHVARLLREDDSLRDGMLCRRPAVSRLDVER